MSLGLGTGQWWVGMGLLGQQGAGWTNFTSAKWLSGRRSLTCKTGNWTERSLRPSLALTRYTLRLGEALGSWVPVSNVLSPPGIRQLQLVLLKVALLLGVEIHWGVTFTGLQPPPKKGEYFCS